jgi:hypothetical protein
MGPHQVEAPAWLRKKEEEALEAAWVNGLSWEALQLQQEGSPCGFRRSTETTSWRLPTSRMNVFNPGLTTL